MEGQRISKTRIFFGVIIGFAALLCVMSIFGGLS